MQEKITVSNGRYCKKIELAELASAKAEGFERPLDRGCTIVGNERWVFEIPVQELPAVKASGLKELILGERKEFDREVIAKSNDQSPEKLSSVVLSKRELSKTDPKANIEVCVLQGIDRAQVVEHQARVMREQEVAEAKGWRHYSGLVQLWWSDHRSAVSKQLRGSGISAAVHISLLLLLASFFLEKPDEPKSLLVASTSSDIAPIEEVIFDTTPLEIAEPVEDQQEDQASETEESVPQAFEAPDFLGAVRGDAIKPPSKPSAATGKSDSLAIKESSFFGSKVSAVDYVFVIDNSNSMTGGRFETALNELLISVNQLTARQRFYVIFYSDTAYPMFHPQPAMKLIPATPRNKEMLRRWLLTVQLCLKTDGKEAIQAAFQLQPDVIFVLGDGAFTDKASAFFASRPQRKIPLHTLGMEVKPKDAISFKRLAEANGGTYKDVGVSPQAKVFAKANPRPRNNKRGPIWGLKLAP